MAIYIVFGNTINGISAKNALNHLIKPKEKRVSNKVNFMTSSVVLVLPGLLAITIPEVLKVFTVLGGYLSILLAIFFPGIYLSIHIYHRSELCLF